MPTSKSLRKAISYYWEIQANGFTPKLIYNHKIQSFMAVYIYLPGIPEIELIPTPGFKNEPIVSPTNYK